jgi:hypothetical protein
VGNLADAETKRTLLALIKREIEINGMMVRELGVSMEL